MGCQKFLRCAGLAAVVLTGCSWPGHLTINLPAQQAQAQPQPVMAQGDTFAPLQGCAQQRGWATERFGDMVRIRMDNDSTLQFHYDNNHNMVMSMSFSSMLPASVRAERTEMIHMRGNEVYQCAGYGTPVYVGVQDSPPAAPVVYAAQPTPMARSPLCDRLNSCYRDVDQEACDARDARCREEFNLRAEETSDTSCRDGLHRMQTRYEEIRRTHPQMRPLPGACLVPGEQPMVQTPPGPLCGRLNECINDLKREACQTRDPHCNDRYQYNSNYTEQQCQIMLDEMATHVADQIRQTHPGFVMPGTCHR